MRITIDVRREYEKVLEQQAALDHRTTREQASYLLHLKLKEIESKHATETAA